MFTTHYTWANGEWDSWAPWDISITERFPNPLLIRHRFVATVSYELPGQNLGGAAGALLGGWQANVGAFVQADCRTTSATRCHAPIPVAPIVRTWCVTRTSRRMSGR